MHAKHSGGWAVGQAGSGTGRTHRSISAAGTSWLASARSRAAVAASASAATSGAGDSPPPTDVVAPPALALDSASAAASAARPGDMRPGAGAAVGAAGDAAGLALPAARLAGFAGVLPALLAPSALGPAPPPAVMLLCSAPSDTGRANRRGLGGRGESHSRSSSLVAARTAESVGAGGAGRRAAAPPGLRCWDADGWRRRRGGAALAGLEKRGTA